MATFRINKALGIAVVGLSALLASSAVSFAQGEQSPAQVRDALQKAIGFYKNGDFEQAAGYFDYAQKGQQSLALPEQQDLATFGSHNSNALKSQRDGALQIRQAEDAVKAGDVPEAGKLLNGLNSNQHLSAADRLKLADLNRQLQSKVPTTDLKGKTDGKTMLASGRSALQAGDLDAADAWATQAEKATSMMPTWLQPWGDSPAKLRRDIQAARAKLQPATPAPVAKNEPEPKDGSSWIPSMKWFSKSEKQPEPTPKTADTAPKQADPAGAPSKLGGLWPFGGPGKDSGAAPKKDNASSSERRVDEKIARHMVKDGFVFLEANDLEKARFVALKAKEMNVTWGPNEQTPDLLLHEIQRRSGGTPATPVTPTEAKSPTPATQGKTPDATAKKPIEVPKDMDPRVALRQGRTLLGQKKFEEADRYCTQALNSKVRWGLWEDNPEKLRRDIIAGRKVADRDESVRLMVEARTLFAKGSVEEAETKAYKAKQLHGPYGVFDFGDRPDKLLEEINRVKSARGPDKTSPFDPKKDAQQAKENPNKFVPPVDVPAGIQIANKNRAIVMLREARELERQGMLIEARQKVFEARALRAPFQPDEESPDHVLTSLTAKCDRQIAAHLQQAVDKMGNASDPQRLDKSQAHVVSARKLAQAFELDATRIDQAALHLQQIAAGSATITPATFVPKVQDPFRAEMPKMDPPSGDPKLDAMRKLGREKLLYAQRELSHGNYPQARKMAEELFNPAYGIQDDVLRFVRSVKAEEDNQEILAAMRNFEVGVNALADKDYRKAMAIFQSIDPLILPEQHQARLRDIMGMREMQPQELAKAEKLKGRPIEEKKPFGPPMQAEDDLIGNVKAAEMVQFQALRQRGYDALKKAHEQWKQDQRDEAIKTLRDYVAQVNLAGMEGPKANELRRPIDTRLQQYTAMQADRALASADKKMQFTSYHDESKREREIRKRQDEMVVLMKEAHELYKQNKLKEAVVIARKVLEIDRENGPARMLVSMADTKAKQEDWDRVQHANWDFFEKALPHGLGKPLDMDNPVEINPKMVARRTQGDGSIPHLLKDPKERAIQYRLRQPISLNLKDRPLKDAIKDIAILSGVQVVPDDLELQKARINMDSPLSISVENIDMKFALNILLRPLQLTYIIEDQVLKITTENRTIGRLTRITYPIADLIVPVEDHPLPDALNIQKAIERSMQPSGVQAANFGVPSPYQFSQGTPVSSHGAGLGGTFGSQAPGPNGSIGTPSKERTKDENARIFIDLIKNCVAKDKWDDVGGTGSIQYFPMGLALVINQTQEVQEEIQLLLATLRKLQDLQVSVELRAVLVSEAFFERIGLDFDMNIRTPTSRTEPSLVQGSFVPAPFINRFGSGLNLISGLTPAGTLTPDLNVPIRNSTFNFTTPQFGGYQPEAGLSLGLAFLSDIQVFMFLEAVQGDRRAHIMQAPKISVYNGQQATIGGLMVRPVVTGVTPVPLANGNMMMIPTITPMPFGLSMTVQPVVSPDRRFIRLNVTPNLANGIQDPAGAIVIAVPQIQTGVFDGGIPQPPLPTGPLNVTVNPTTANLLIANTTVNVPDGGTVLLGGFKFLAEERTEYGPPILSKIPYLSRLFRNVGWSRDGSTLIYLVTARVIMIEEEEGLFMGTIPPIPGR